jgi:hypothetical protein
VQASTQRDLGLGLGDLQNEVCTRRPLPPNPPFFRLPLLPLRLLLELSLRHNHLLLSGALAVGEVRGGAASIVVSPPTDSVTAGTPLPCEASLGRQWTVKGARL